MDTAYIDNDIIEELYECVPHNDDTPDEIFEINCQKKNGNTSQTKIFLNLLEIISKNL